MENQNPTPPTPPPSAGKLSGPRRVPVLPVRRRGFGAAEFHKPDSEALPIDCSIPA